MPSWPAQAMAPGSTVLITIMLVGFGAGLTYGGTYMTWPNL